MKTLFALGSSCGFRNRTILIPGKSCHQNCSRSVYMSSIYRPVIVNPGKPSGTEPAKKSGKKNDETLSKSLRLLVDNGLIKQSTCTGAFYLLPIAVKAMEKLINLIDSHMMTLENCQKIQMPTLTSTHLWKTSGRFEECRPELMHLKDRHSKEYLLSPTHEEAVCDLLRSPPLTFNQLPKRLYQITEKFRDEHRPRFGLLRARQFLMKDLYTFDTTLEAAQFTYGEVNKVYQKILNSLELNWVKAQGSTGNIGGLFSHEFHVLSAVGEDSIIQCSACNHVFNKDLLQIQEEEKMAATGDGNAVSTTDSIPKCLNCQSTSSLSSSTSIEVCHSFLLGTKYTKPLQTYYFDENSKKVPMEMGCYGLGVSRLFAAALEVKSLEQELRWPLRLAPYVVSIVPPKHGSKEEFVGKPLADKLYDQLKKFLPNDVLYDDRKNHTIGKRLQDIKKLGIPFVVVCGKSIHDSAGPRLELHDINLGKVDLTDMDDIVKRMYDVKSEIKLKL